MANLFSQLKQWSNKVRGSSSQPSSRTLRQRKATPRTGISKHNQSSQSNRSRQWATARLPYQKPLFWIVLLVGAGIAGPSAQFYRLWSDLNKTVPDVTKALTYERSGTITFKDEDGKVLQ
ncbi:MAG: hypothetical protein WBA76_19805, partial [Phormidesmis sp.]